MGAKTNLPTRTKMTGIALWGHLVYIMELKDHTQTLCPYFNYYISSRLIILHILHYFHCYKHTFIYLNYTKCLTNLTELFLMTLKKM